MLKKSNSLACQTWYFKLLNHCYDNSVYRMEQCILEPVYFREGQHYSFSDLEKAFCLDEENTTKRINVLKRFNILKIVRKNKPEFTELSDQDIVIGDVPEDSSEYTFQFSYVGVILLQNLIILCYPKYIDNDKKPFEKLKTIFKVLEKYNHKEQLVHLYNGDAESEHFNQLLISLHILTDYFENGLYSSQQEKIELNGDGEILWDKTINETFAFIKDNMPYYLNYYSHDNTDDDLDYIRRLHAAIVSKCSKDLANGNLLELFGLENAELTSQALEDFGDTDYIEYRLEQEIKKQFVTRKQSLLKTLYTYIAKKQSNQTEECFGLYGTNSFNLVWEKICAELFCNVYDKAWKVSNLAEHGLIDRTLCTPENKNKNISDYIEKPEWKIAGNVVKYSGDLIPDIISLRKEKSGNCAMYILDGKYYLLSVKDGNLYGNPGIQDVIKQYVYNASLQSFIDEFKIGEIANAFLIPALESDVSAALNFGEVPYWTVQHSGFKKLPVLQVIKLKPNEVWKSYLENNSEFDSVLDRIQKSPTANYLYHNENDDSVIQINDDKKHILVGMIRKEVMKDILNTRKKGFLFYFYATGFDKKSGKFIRYPLHPYIDSCTEFIGYTNDKKQFIHGSLKQIYNRCRIDEIHAEELSRILSENKKNAQTYYVVTVEKLSGISSIPYDNLVPTNEKLNELIKQNGLNDVLFKTSPKVIDV